MTEYGLSAYAAGVLTAERSVADYYEGAVSSSSGADPETVANWIAGDLFGLMNEAGQEISEISISSTSTGQLVSFVYTGQISSSSGKHVMEELFTKGGSPQEIIENEGLSLLSDAGVIRPVVEQVLSDNPDQVAAYLAGKTALSEWFLGQVMKATQGKADPAAVRLELESALGELEERQSSR